MDVSKKLGKLAFVFFLVLMSRVTIASQQLLLMSRVTIASQQSLELAADQNEPEPKSEDKADAAIKLEVIRESGEKSKQESAKKPKINDKSFSINQLTFPEDTTPRIVVREIHISGNSLISTDKLLEKIPLVYNASDKPLMQAQSNYLYDFGILHDIILNPGQAYHVSTRTIQGFTQYLLSVYQQQNYAGIYVRVPSDAMKEGGKLTEDILPIEIVEIPVSDIRTTFYDVEHNEKEKRYLSLSVFQEWSPVKSGQVINKKKMDDFINLLNLNPDRYISATISKGKEPQSLAVEYDIFEINPWHYFIQVDNAGTKDRRWNPRAGFINTNLTGRDDRLTAIAQAPVEKGMEDNYSVYGSYDFPLWTPRLRLDLFGSRSEYDVDGGEGIDFLGKGYSYGGKLRFNVFQQEGWFFDLTSSLSREKSTVTTSLFPQFFGSKVYLDLWGIGLDVHRRSDMANTSFVFNRIQSIGGSGQDRFWDPATSTGARTDAQRDFKIVTLSVNHSQFLDTDKVQRFLGSLKYIRPDDRLIPAKMTTFGGMYSVRGYKESRIVADGGIIGSFQYEFDLVRKDEMDGAKSGGSQKNKEGFKKIAPLVFFDYGRAKTKDPVAGENRAEELCSLGLGMIIEHGENFNAGIYYGYPLRSAGETNKGDGRFNIGLMLRF